MVTSQQALKKYGDPTKTEFQYKHMIMWDVPPNLEIGMIPKRIFCNKDMIDPLSKAFKNLIDTGAVKELKTWDGCFNIRNKRGLSSLSLHSWGIAIDVNAFSNPLGLTREQIVSRGLTPFSEKFLQCFRDAGFDCGADWKTRPDFMHMQLTKI
jgi:hypothetical protein